MSYPLTYTLKIDSTLTAYEILRNWPEGDWVKFKSPFEGWRLKFIRFRFKKESQYFSEKILPSENFIFPLWSINQSSILTTNTRVIQTVSWTNWYKNQTTRSIIWYILAIFNFIIPHKQKTRLITIIDFPNFLIKRNWSHCAKFPLRSASIPQ